jgi:transcriptional regulator with XRE-family HTH domain
VVVDKDPLPEECQRVLRRLVRSLNGAMRERRRSQASIARQLGCHRSTVARALSGRDVPPRDRIEQIAMILGVNVRRAMGRWDAADRLRKAQRRSSSPASAVPSGGCPPDGLRSYPDLLQGLRDLMHECDVSQRQLCLRDSRLSRSMGGAVLRGERSASLRMVNGIVRACGVSTEAQQAWAEAWWRFGKPCREAAHQRRREGYRYMLTREAPRW